MVSESRPSARAAKQAAEMKERISEITLNAGLIGKITRDSLQQAAD
jgi:hypothetical protein